MSKKNILIVEDNDSEAIAFSNIMEQAGFVVERASDGALGFSLIKEKRPDLVLLDLILPKMTGFDILSHCQKDPELKEIPIIVLTNLTQGDEVTKSLSLGAKDHLIKTSISAPDLVRKVKKFMQE